MQINLTNNQINQMIWAIELTLASYDGYTNAELKDCGIAGELKTLRRLQNKFMAIPDETKEN
jgi:hypothetical protein